MPAWNQQTASRRDNHTRFLTKRFPVKPSGDTWYVNPSLPPGATRLAQSIGSTGHRRPIIPPVTPEWLLLYTAPLQARNSSAPPGSVGLANDADAFALGYPNIINTVSGVKAFEYNIGTDTFDNLANVESGNSGVNAEYLEYATAVALSADATVLAVGAPNESDEYRGGVNVFKNVDGSWTLKNNLGLGFVDDTPNARFGSSVSLSNYDNVTERWYMAVAAPGANGINVFSLLADGSFSSNIDKERGSLYGGTDGFGTSVSISDYRDGAIRVAIGAPDGTNGYVRIIELDGGGSWFTRYTIIREGTNNFGASVSLSADGTIIAVGDPENGTAYVYYDNGGGWRLLPGGVLTGQSSTSLYGTAVSVDRDASSSNLNGIMVAVGEPEYSIPARTKTGRVEVMEHLNGKWVRVLNSIVGLSEHERFGESVALKPGGQYFVAGGGATIGRTAVYGISPLNE